MMGINPHEFIEANLDSFNQERPETNQLSRNQELAFVRIDQPIALPKYVSSINIAQPKSSQGVAWL